MTCSEYIVDPYIVDPLILLLANLSQVLSGDLWAAATHVLQIISSCDVWSKAFLNDTLRGRGQRYLVHNQTGRTQWCLCSVC